MRSNKGQVFSADALLGMIVFLFALTVVFYYFSQLSERDLEFTESFEIKIIALNSASVLVETPGFPENWESLQFSQARSLGIASSRNVLSAEKIARLSELSQEDNNSARKLLGLGKFNFALSIMDFNSEEIYSINSSRNASVSFKTSRIALLNDRPVFVYMEVFK